MKENTLVFYNNTLLSMEELGAEKLYRAWMYGDGFFESILVSAYKIPFLKQHLQRIQKASVVFGFEIQIDLEAQIEELLKAKNLSTARVKVLFWRRGSGLYFSAETQVEYLILADEYNISIEEPPISLCMYSAQKKYPSEAAAFKTLSSLMYVSAQRFAKSKGYDEAIILNTVNRVAETASSSLFIIKDNIIYTPKSSEAPIEGVLRNYFIEHYNAVETEILIEDVLSADEVFITSGIRLVRGVSLVEDKKFPILKSKNLRIDLLNKLQIGR